MHFLDAVADYLTAASNWRGPDGFAVRALTQLELSGIVVASAALLGVGLGFFLGHRRRGGFLAVNAANAARAVPSLALLTLLVLTPAIALRGDGFDASYLTLVALAVPPILTNAYVAMREVDPDLLESASALGMSRRQRFWRVEVPLALPLAYAGFRTATLEVVATSTLAAYVSFNDLGDFIFAGLNTNNNVESFGGAVLVALLAGLTDLALYGLWRLASPLPRPSVLGPSRALRSARRRVPVASS